MNENENLEVNENLDPVSDSPDTNGNEAPDTPEQKNNITNLFSADSPDLAVLDDDERDLYLDTQAYGDVELASLPPDLRQEIRDVRTKLSAPPAAEPESKVEEEAAPADDSPVEKSADYPFDPAGNAEVEAADSFMTTDAERIAMLIEENRKLKAQYSTLQGKYNKEIKSLNSTGKSPESSSKGDTPEQTASEAADSDADAIRQLAETYGLDDEVTGALVGISKKQTNKLNSQMDALQAQLLNMRLDSEIRNRCGVTLDEIDDQPLFEYVAGTLENGLGIKAIDAIREGKANGNLREVASIVSQVVNNMRSTGKWHDGGGHFATGAKPDTLISLPGEAQAVPPAATTAAAEAAKTVKPSAVTPHNVSGVTNHSLHTGKDRNQVQKEYDQLENRRRRGDMSVLPRMRELDRMLDTLEEVRPT